MSEPEPSDLDTTFTKYTSWGSYLGPRTLAWVLAPPILLCVLFVLTFFRSGGGPQGPPDGGPPGSTGKDAPLAQLRDSLARQTDLSTCRTAVSQANSHLPKARADDRPQPLP